MSAHISGWMQTTEGVSKDNPYNTSFSNTVQFTFTLLLLMSFHRGLTTSEFPWLPCGLQRNLYPGHSHRLQGRPVRQGEALSLKSHWPSRENRRAHTCSEGTTSQHGRENIHVSLPHTKMTKQPVSSRDSWSSVYTVWVLASDYVAQASRLTLLMENASSSHPYSSISYPQGCLMSK